ncbi:TPA: Paratox [Streptococcus suis]|uniref:competence regulator inhibitor paratox n=1 Tax=Streptococcus suis TaxID=1307 RepID=UPI0009420346|nr:Paratox [Streptococcus suis]NQJ18327.1 Paratox [Streptococcus suis]HEL1912144.1 Paratox [Streptococcus suis]HEL2223684.1 Paratox [Streptococcus suis]HEL2541541.1 Paratox [Streptococcus suis]HEL2667333.1 Paratox [Streptococcus suis]
MLEYEELKQAVDDGYVTGDTVNIVRRDGKVFDYVLPGEQVRSWEAVSEEKVEDVLKELKKTLSRGRGIVGEL